MKETKETKATTSEPPGMFRFNTSAPEDSSHFFVIRLTEPFPVFSAAEEPPASPPAESASKPLKRLFIKANCTWSSNADRTFVLKKLCEAMARQQLTKPFWIKQYHIIPISETVQGTGNNQCIQYRVQVTTPKAKREKLQIPANLATRGRQKILKPAAEQKQVNGKFKNYLRCYIVAFSVSLQILVCREPEEDHMSLKL